MSSSLYQELQCLLKPEPRVSVSADDSLSLGWSSRSSSALSLQMCTESLGSETGSDVSDELISISPDLGGKKAAPRSAFFSKKVDKSGFFPPPLTTSGFHMRPHREEGRLVIEAMSVSPWRRTLLVERSEGRLRVGVMSEEEDDTVEEADEDNGEGEEIEGNGEIVEGEMGSDKFSRPMRCKERGLSNYQRLVSWPKPFLVAT